MVQNINAEIVSIGTELLLGEITDTNSAYIARKLRDIGVSVYRMTTLGDNQGRITGEIRQAMLRADVVITTGGLGPTVDDMTRQAVAAATGRDLVFHQFLLDDIAARFAGFRSNMTENNRQQAWLPRDALLLENAVGTAPCFLVEHEGSVIISLPGVPREMRFVLATHVLPWLQKRYHLGVIRAHVLRAAGIGESALDDLIGVDLLAARNPTVGLAAHSGVVDMRVTARAENESRADALIREVAEELYRRAGAWIFGTDDDTIEAALITRLRQGGHSLALSETGIGHALVDRLGQVAGYKSVLRHAEAHDTLDTLPGGDESLRELASNYAATLARQHGSDVAIVVISDPERLEDQADRDVGTAVAVSVEGQLASRVYGFGPRSREARLWTGTWSMAQAWRMLGETRV
ncbi:MAG: CinA family nicotinamide mononucleotide deamidase-related protein [Anaerolineaceae bacterium]|nr:CinA family nicotinamide mononucleotide deamidase-related protein [Anaerolineaceae bacterium]